ncbi:type I-C CRISPR-associated protein Cas8c/Csd1 [Paenibacillus xylaniclasticus]|uniref:type I-C CRISPR-associated protein Cas8c/Csd1 n=1 Tax=Paenibacillus xylaniclasticus TaxID=588083 RepID=UPI000FD8E2F9|nr:type I-C CRISPR-associated protein Cas8c/Csd1 [Paenibacillus xylaniclasticus]
MSWLLNLYETYEANLDLVGKIEKRHNDQEYTLLPVSHTTQTAHIEVYITEDGEYHSASVIIDKNDANTLIPCTEDSASRAGSKIAPYPLHDKLSYVAGDYVAFGGEIKKEEPFQYYIKQLEEWANSPYAIDKVRSIYRYLKKGTLIRDLVNDGIVHLDDNQRLLNKWMKSGTKPGIFSVVSADQTSAFVRFTVYAPDRDLAKVWEDQAMYNSFIQYYSGKLGEEDVCYVTGRTVPATDKHANKIRNAGDKAKLISANDTSGFTYRGRFREGNEAACISYEVSQKAHNALKWLINRQGKVIDGRVFLAWGNEALDVPGPNEDSYSLDPEGAEYNEQRISYTNRDFARELAKALEGYRNRIADLVNDKVNIIVLDSATTGRMAVLYYRNMDVGLYLDKLIDWHTSCVWLHRYRKNEQGDYVSFYGAPATKDIAYAAYGPNASDKVVKGCMERMLPCIVDGRPIPEDIKRSLFHRASNPAAMDKWEWEKTLSIACALVNKSREGFGVALDQDNNDRSYLFGRLLAVADVLERRALGEENRASNAIRYMNMFSKYPARTWATIQSSLLPYQVRLGTKAIRWSKIIDEIGSRIKPEDFNNKPLSDLYLLGFYSQRHELYQKANSSNDSKEDSEESLN